MCQALHLRGDERVLEVGTGSGYGAAVLSRLAAEVVTVERISSLATSAAKRLAKLGYDNVHVHTADGTLGWPLASPYDAIVVTAGAAALPPAYLEQLNPGGRVVIPIGSLHKGQTMCRFTRRGHDSVVEKLGPFAFVPLIGEQGWMLAEGATD
jgi:protein-L-isoaspartate(D-aspartate) O-methyltransferase